MCKLAHTLTNLASHAICRKEEKRWKVHKSRSTVHLNIQRTWCSVHPIVKFSSRLTTFVSFLAMENPWPSEFVDGQIDGQCTTNNRMRKTMVVTKWSRRRHTNSALTFVTNYATALKRILGTPVVYWIVIKEHRKMRNTRIDRKFSLFHCRSYWWYSCCTGESAGARFSMQYIMSEILDRYQWRLVVAFFPQKETNPYKTYM